MNIECFAYLGHYKNTPPPHSVGVITSENPSHLAPLFKNVLCLSMSLQRGYIGIITAVIVTELLKIKLLSGEKIE